MRSDKKTYVYCKETRKFLRKLPDGTLALDKEREETPDEMRKRILSLSILRNDKLTGNGFQPHYSETLGKYISTRGQLDSECKKQGFDIAGDAPPPQYNEDIKSEGLNDSDIKELNEKGAGLSEKEADFIKAV